MICVQSNLTFTNNHSMFSCHRWSPNQPTLTHLNHPGLNSRKDSSHFDNLQLKVRENPPMEYHLKEVKKVQQCQWITTYLKQYEDTSCKICVPFLTTHHHIPYVCPHHIYKFPPLLQRTCIHRPHLCKSTAY